MRGLRTRSAGSLLTHDWRRGLDQWGGEVLVREDRVTGALAEEKSLSTLDLICQQTWQINNQSRGRKCLPKEVTVKVETWSLSWSKRDKGRSSRQNSVGGSEAREQIK